MRNETEQFRRDFLKKSAGMAAMAMGAAPLLGSQQARAASALDKQALRTIGLLRAQQGRGPHRHCRHASRLLQEVTPKLFVSITHVCLLQRCRINKKSLGQGCLER